MNKKIRLQVNEKPHELEVPTHRLLIDTLRYDLGLTGTKEGCSVGVCGACAVLMGRGIAPRGWHNTSPLTERHSFIRG